MKSKLNIFIPYIVIAILFVDSSSNIFAQSASTKITLDDIYEKKLFSSKYVWGIKSLKDGTHYSKLKSNDKTGNTDILAYDLISGDLTDTIFKGNWLLPDDTSKKPISYSAYTFCDDESMIMLRTASERIYRYSTIENNYIWNRKDKKLLPLSVHGKQRYAKFSPDGNKAAFVRDNNIYIVDFKTNKETQITKDGKKNEIINGATDWVYEEEFGFTRAFFWSPDGAQIAFYRFDESHVKEYSMPMYGTVYPKNNTFKYPKTGEKNAYISIHVYNLNSKELKTIDIGPEKDQYIPRIKWTHNSNILSIQRMNRHQNKLELLFADINSGVSNIVLTENNKAYIDVTDDLTFLKGSKQFLWTSERSGFNQIYLYNMDGTLINPITEGRWDIASFYGVDEKKGLVYYLAYDGSPLEKYVFSIQLDGKGKTKLMKKKGMNRATFTPDFSYFIGYHSDANTPNDIAVYDANGGFIRSLEDNADLKKLLKAYSLPQKEFFSFKTSEGVQLNGWMIKPPDFKKSKKYPVLMYVYGGPGSQTVSNSWAGRSYFWYQHLAQQGYIIVSIDNRGTGGRGEAFKKVTYLKLGQYEPADQIEGAKYLATLKYVNPHRIGIWGWSYGGYTSALCILQGAEIFKMAIAVAPVSHWKFYDTIYTERFMRTPKENPEGYKAGAPLTYIDKLKGKLLIIHGTADDNVHFQNSVELIGALIKANKQFDMAIYPDKNHSIYGGVTRWQLYTKMTNYILENL